MARRKSNSTDQDGVEQLRKLVEQNEEPADRESKTQTRRGLLRMAGAALAGAAGAAALRAIPAAAAAGQPVLQGCINFAGPGSSTILEMAATAAPTNIAGGTGFGVQGGSGVLAGGLYATTPALEIGVMGSSKSTNGPGTGVYGVAGTGVGGLFHSTTGYDAQLGYSTAGGQVGSGRLAQIGRTDVGVGSTSGFQAPSWAPAFAVHTTFTNYFQHEIVRGNYDGSIWASRYDTASTPVTKRWKRINAVRVDRADGTGASYKPFRVIDTRSGLYNGGTSAGNKGPFATATSKNWVIAGTGTGAQAIPGDAIAVFGNLTVTNFTGSGWLIIAPTGAGTNPTSDPSSVNFGPGTQPAIANSFICGLNGGSLTVFVEIGSGSNINYIIDITGYIQ